MTIVHQMRNVIMTAVIPFTLCVIASAPVHAVNRRPNVLLIMTDDQGWGDIRSHGNDQIDTPVMDRTRLAAGTTFDGAAIVEQYDSTILILPGQLAEIDALGNIVIRTRASEAEQS